MMQLPLHSECYLINIKFGTYKQSVTGRCGRHRHRRRCIPVMSHDNDNTRSFVACGAAAVTPLISTCPPLLVINDNLRCYNEAETESEEDKYDGPPTTSNTPLLEHLTRCHF